MVLEGPLELGCGGWLAKEGVAWAGRRSGWEKWVKGELREGTECRALALMRRHHPGLDVWLSHQLTASSCSWPAAGRLPGGPSAERMTTVGSPSRRAASGPGSTAGSRAEELLNPAEREQSIDRGYKGRVSRNVSV